MDIITGYRGTPHITSMQDRAKNQGVIGEGSYILDVGQQLAAEIVSANEIRVRDGVLSHQGCVANIAAGAYDSLEISNGTQGMLRTDLIVARYTKDAETNVENISLVVIEGEAAASAPATPSYNEGDIQSGDSPVDMPLYKVNINGVTISSVDLIADTIWSLQSIGDTVLPTTAQTISGAIAEHEQDISQINGNLSVTGIYNLGLAIDVKPASFNVPSNSRHFLLITGPYSTRGHAIYAVSGNNAGAVYAYKIGGTDDMPASASGSNNSLAISSTSTASATCDICDICLYGNKITIPN